MKKEILFTIVLTLATTLTGCSMNSYRTGTMSSDKSQYIVEADSYPERQAVPNTDWMVIQEKKDREILEEMKGGYSVDAPLVVIDPYRAAPLTALIVFDEQIDCSVIVTIPGKSEYTTFTHSFTEVGIHHEIPVFGLYAGMENQVKLTLEYVDGTTKEYTVPITTEPLPDYIAPYEMRCNQPELVGGVGDEVLFVAMATNTVYPFAIDKEGDVRWYSSHNGFSGGIFRRISDGNFLAFTEPIYAPAFIRPGFITVDRMGKVYSQYLLDLLHHDIIELPNGNFLADTLKLNHEINLGAIVVGEDIVSEVEKGTGKVLRSWDLNAICGYTAEDVKNGKYLHTNSIWYDESDNSIIASSPTMKVVVKFDANTHKIIWAIGDPRNEYPALLQNKIPTPIGENFEWNGSQHAAMVLPNGNIMFDDNGSGRLDLDGNPVKDVDNYSRLVIYDIDEKKMTIEQVYQYGKERGNELFATYLGDVDYLGENHYILNAGGRIVGDEGIAQGSAFDVFMGIKRAEAKVVELKNGLPILEIHVGTDTMSSFNNLYRVEWDSVYSVNQKEYNLAAYQPKLFGALAESKTVEFTMPAEKKQFEVNCVPTNYGYQLNVSVISDEVQSKDTLLMELKSNNDTRYYTTMGMGGAEGIVRRTGLNAEEYAINFVLLKEDNSVEYAQTGYKWDLR